MDGIDQAQRKQISQVSFPGKENIDHHKQELFGERKPTSQNHAEQTAWHMELNSAAQSPARKTDESLKGLKDVTESSKKISLELKDIAKHLEAEKAELNKIEKDLRMDLKKDTDVLTSSLQRRRNLLVDGVNFQTDVILTGSARGIIQRRTALGIGAIGTVGAIQATCDIMALSKSESLKDAILPSAGLLADAGLIGGSLSFLSKNPATAKFRVPLVLGSLLGRTVISGIEWGKALYER